MKRSDEISLQGALLLKAPRMLPNLRLFRRSIAAVRIHDDDRGDRIIRFGVAGQSDLYGITRGGKHLEVELKGVGGALTKDQRAWRDWCVEWKIPHLTLYAKPHETTEHTVDRWLNEIESALL